MSSNEILQTGLTLVKSAVDADNQKNYSLASNLYEQAILNLKLALVQERDPAKNALISSKVEEYTQRNKFIKNLLSTQPGLANGGSNGSTNNNLLNTFPSVPPSISPSSLVQHQQQQQPPSPPMSNNSYVAFPNPSMVSNNSNNSSNDALSKLNSLSFNNNIGSGPNPNIGRVEAYEAAKNFALKGRKEEEVKNYKGASGFYEQACSYYLISIKNEPDPTIKKNIGNEAKIYLDRIETLKPYVQQQQQQQQHVPTAILNSFPSASSSSGINTSSSSISSQPSMSSMSSYHQQHQQQQQSMNSNNINHNNQLNNSGFLIPTISNSMPSIQQQFLQSHQFNANNNSFNNSSSMLPSSFGGDKCAACGANLSTNSIKALDRNWHPECFSVSIICAGCTKPFSLVNLSLKVRENKAYHPTCFEGTTGLYQEEIRKFTGSSKTLFFSIQLQRKFYRPGETIQFAFIIDNPTSKKVDKVVAYLHMTETRMEIVGTAYERKAKTTVKKLGRCEFYHSNRFPLVKDRFEGDFFFSIPPNVQPSEVAGVDASFVREYQLVVKCVGPPLKIMTVKLRFNLNLLDPQKPQ